MSKIIILSNESGGGHKQTAAVLLKALQQKGREVTVVNTFRELFFDLDFGAKWFGLSGEDIYNKLILQNEASQFVYKLFFFSIYYLFFIPKRKTIIKRLGRFFEQQQPDLVISVIPIINHELAAALRQRHIPFLVIQTDLFEYEEASLFWRWLVPYGAWFVADKYSYMASGTTYGYQQALSYQPDANRVVQLSGTVIDPRFLQQRTFDVALERQKFNLKTDQPIGLFLYGGYPPGRLLKLAKQLDRLKVKAQLIFICGKNRALQQSLTNLTTGYKKIVLGYCNDVPYYMQLADFLVGKSGPGAIMEGMALGLPLLLDISHVMPHEQSNAPWVEQQQRGMAFKTARQLCHAIDTLNNKKSRIKPQLPFDNRAIFEVVELTEKLLLGDKSNGAKL